MPDAPDPDSIATEAALANALAALADRADLTTRGLAKITKIPHTSIAGYLKGQNLPRSSSGALGKILRACGLSDREEIARWESALRRLWWARRHPQETGPQETGYGLREPEMSASLVELPVSAIRVVVSIRPPEERLAEEPGLVGRKDLLDTLSHGLDQHSIGHGPARVHILYGMGGSGKSSLALALVRRARQRGVRVWWLSGAGAAMIAEGMQALAVDLGASRELIRLGSPPDVVWRLLHRYRQPWLLVIDDADDPRRDLCPCGAPVTDATGWVRPVEGRYGMVVITTRDGDPAIWGRHSTWLRAHRVAPLSSADGARVLRELAGAEAGSQEDARHLAGRLGGLPLALRLAGLHLAEARRFPASLAGPLTYADFAHTLDEGPGILDDATPLVAEQRARRRIGQTWELSLDLLETRGLTHARPLLRLLSCLRPVAVPYGMLLQPDVFARSALFSGLTASSLRETVRALATVGLIDLTADLLTVHPLVRDTSRIRVAGQADDYLRLLTELLTRVADTLDPKDPRSWPRWRVLADHCRAPLDLLGALGTDQPPAATVLRPATLAARYLHSSGRLEQAEELYAAVITAARTVFPMDHPALLVLRHDHSRVRHMLGDYAEAERGFRDVLAARRSALGVRHAETLTTQHYLARVLRDLGQQDEAENLLRRTFQARDETLGSTHSDTLTSKNNLADLLRARGRLDEAERMLNEVRMDRTRLLGPEFPATLITRHYLALVAHDRGDLARASAELEDLATACVGVLGPDHPRTLTVQQSLGEVWHALGDQERAERILTEVLAIRTRILGAAHPHTVLTAAWLDTVRG